MLSQLILLELFSPSLFPPNLGSSHGLLSFAGICCRLTNNILSTGQQVWLRKLGGAKNPKQIIDDSIEKVQAQPLKSISVAPPAKKVVQKDKKLTPEGLRPGERLNRWQFI